MASSVDAKFCKQGIRGTGMPRMRSADSGVNFQQPTSTTNPPALSCDAAVASVNSVPSLPCNQTTSGKVPAAAGRRTAASWRLLLLPPAPSIFNH